VALLPAPQTLQQSEKHIKHIERQDKASENGSYLFTIVSDITENVV
jgi:hypothetical protein